MIDSSFLFFLSKKKKKCVPLSRFYKNRSGAVLIEAAFVLPLIFFLFGSIFILSMSYMRYRSMDSVASDIARRFLYTRATLATTPPITTLAQLQAAVCRTSYIMLKCSDLKIYIDAYEHGKFDTITAAPGLEPIFTGSTLKTPWLKRDNNVSFSTTYFEDNASSIFIVRIGYPGTGYVGISMTQGQ
jgi:Flp pilus assembly protein TadG